MRSTSLALTACLALLLAASVGLFLAAAWCFVRAEEHAGLTGAEHETLQAGRPVLRPRPFFSRAALLSPAGLALRARGRRWARSAGLALLAYAAVLLAALA